ncbi:MAG TPA: PEP-CTERM sorting domain-containing protein [Phycisphaerae bacterium]|nr:PEP-CTERM sorting domain-containing protein [Phycisphaerae bacterium]
MKTLSTVIFASIVAAAARPLFADSTLYVCDSNGELATVNADTGAVTDIGVTKLGNSTVVLTDIAMNSSGALYGITDTNLYTVSTSTAALTHIGSFGSGIDSLNALVFSSTGTLYSASGSNSNIYTINTSTGAATALSGTTGSGVDSAGDLAFNPDVGGDLYESDTKGDLVKITLPPPSVSGTVIGSFDISNEDDMDGMATGTDGLLYGVAGTDIYSINVDTGKATYVSMFDDSEHYFCSNGAIANGATAPLPAQPVPEPATLGLMSVGGLLLLGKRRKKS